MLSRTDGFLPPVHRAASLAAVAMLALVLPVAIAAITPAPVRAATHVVEIGDGFFSPASLTVAAGDTVTWTNVDDSPHTVTSATFDSGNLDAGQSFSHTFAAAGTFGYVCSYHDEMAATITVEATTTATAATPAASTAAAPAAPDASHSAGTHGEDQPDTALPFPASGSIPGWIAPLLMGVGLLSFAIGVVPQRVTRVPATRRDGTVGGWRR